MPLTPSQRSQRSRIAAHSMHAAGRTNTKPARKAFLDRFERQVDPDGVLSPAERAKRAAHARRAYMAQLAYRSAVARGRALRKQGRPGALPGLPNGGQLPLVRRPPNP